MERNKLAIITDSTCDTCRAQREAMGIDDMAYVTFLLDGKEYLADVDWEAISEEAFYGAMRKGSMPRTSQINVLVYEEMFRKHLDQGKDVFYFACSSAISGTINSARIASDMLKEQYPDRKIYILDTIISGSGLGMVIKEGIKMMFEDNMSPEQYLEWFEANKHRYHMVGSVDDCQYLARNGRISGAAAFFTKIFSIKPVVIKNRRGMNQSIAKIKGRRKSIDWCIDYVKENIEEIEKHEVYVSHAVCPEDADYIVERLEKELGCKIVRNLLGPCVGGACGPGQFSIYFFGKEVDPKYIA